MPNSTCPVCGLGRLIYHVGDNKIIAIDCMSVPPCEISPALFQTLSDLYMAELDHRRQLQDLYLQSAINESEEESRWELEKLLYANRIHLDVLLIKNPLVTRRINYPRWIKCPEDCGEYLCTVHKKHASECDCPEIDDLSFDPYVTGGLPQISQAGDFES